jgi:ABC-2 type transport system permease protein
MFNPDDINELLIILNMMPIEMLRAMGFSDIITDLTSFLASWLYGMLMFGFPMVYCIILGNRLVSKMIDNNSFAYLLSTPNSRVKLIVTQGFFALFSLLLLFVLVFSSGLLFSHLIHPGLLDVSAFLKLNIMTMLLNMVIIMICFTSSCIFNESRRSSGVGSGIAVTFLLMNMLGSSSLDLEILKKMSLYGLYNPVDLVRGSNVTGIGLFFLGLIILLFTISVLIFNKKRLPI